LIQHRPHRAGSSGRLLRRHEHAGVREAQHGKPASQIPLGHRFVLTLHLELDSSPFISQPLQPDGQLVWNQRAVRRWRSW
jgi:hypothetical protein